MMKIALICFAIIGVAVAAPIEEETRSREVPIVRSTQLFEADGSYKFSFETGDGIFREETGSIVNPGKEDAYVARVGLYRYKSPDGEEIEVNYTADIKGYNPSGRSVPSATLPLPEMN